MSKQPNFYVYNTTNILNKKIYIGQRKCMALPHVDGYIGSGKILKSAINKYGKKFFIKEILKICYSKEELNFFEQYFISRFDSRNPKIGYNIAIGGNFYKKTKRDASKGKIVFTEEHKRNISIGKKGKKMSKEARESMVSTMKRGKDHHWFGKSYNKGKKFSEEHRRKISEGLIKVCPRGPDHPNFGKTASEETRRRRSKSLKGRAPGIDFTQEVRDKISKKQKGTLRNHYKNKKSGLPTHIFARNSKANPFGTRMHGKSKNFKTLEEAIIYVEEYIKKYKENKKES